MSSVMSFRLAAGEEELVSHWKDMSYVLYLEFLWTRVEQIQILFKIWHN
jgi:hypothetical protein